MRNPAGMAEVAIQFSLIRNAEIAHAARFRVVPPPVLAMRVDISVDRNVVAMVSMTAPGQAVEGASHAPEIEAGPEGRSPMVIIGVGSRVPEG